MTDKELGTAAGEIFTKAFTLGYETGRLIPDGGMALTAEQVEDVRTVANCALQYGNIASREAADRLRALFPATEPAEEVKPVKFRKMTAKYATANFGFPDVTDPFTRWAYKDSDGDKWAWNGDQWELHIVPPSPAEPAEERRSFPTIQDVPNNTLFHTHGGNGSSLFVRNQSGDLRLCLNAGPEWSKLLRDEDFLPSSGPYVEVPWSKFPQPPADPFAQPAPAEPAEEETTADPWTVQLPEGMTMEQWIESLPDEAPGLLAAVREVRERLGISSPVVPAPTETGPWQRIEDVPESVGRLTDRDGDDWEWDGDNWVTPNAAILPTTYINRNFAPFVAAEEGDA
ncbi:hypothetical protein EN35_20065 [Rhodococcus qingshengii]|nr:hypothetical protein EN35_20065 [Rhodococcus qingshengii]